MRSYLGAVSIDTDDADDIERAADLIAAHLRRGNASMIKAPGTVRTTAYTQPKRVVLHLVNYDREEGAPHNNRTGPETERPQPVENIAVDLRLPEGRRVTSVTLHAPDREKPLTLEFEAPAGRVSFTVPRVRVYGVIAIDTESGSARTTRK